MELLPSNVWLYGREILERLDQVPSTGHRFGVHKGALLLFCGRIWPVFTRHLQGTKSFAEELPHRVESARLVPEWKHFYEVAKAERNSEMAEEVSAFFAPEPRGWRDYSALGDLDVVRQARMTQIEKLLAECELGQEVLIGERVPVALLILQHSVSYARTSWIAIATNPRLADLGFQRVMDPFTCFQEIEMFLGNQLAQTDLAPHRVGSDDVIARQKGFDEQSFRTAAPGHKKENRARNRARKRGA